MRKVKSLKNLLTSAIPFVITLLLGFVKVDVFLKSLGEEVYSLNQLFFQLFAYISLAEAGASSYIIQLYYKYFVTKNRKKIKEIYASSVAFMRKIALIVFLIGLFCSFFLKFLTNNNLSNLYMQIVFMIFILRSVIEYLMLSPKLVMQADQKVYNVNIIYYIFKILEIVFEITLLLIGMDYIVTLLSSCVLRFLTYFFVNRIVFNEYPWLKEKIKTKNLKIKGINNMFIHRIAEAVHYNTDIILTSSFLSPFIVTIYSSYNYITKYLTDGIDLIGNSISASVGNVIYSEKKEDKVKILNELIIIYLVFAMFFSCVCFVSINSFVSLWIGNKYIISTSALIILMINFFIVIARKPLNIYYTASGLYKETRVIVFLEAIINLILSFVLVLKFKITGILIATTISMLTTTFWFIPRLVLSKKLNQKLSNYFFKFFVSLFLTALLSFFGIIIFSFLNINSFVTWALCSLIFSIFILFSICVIMFCFSSSFRRVLYKVVSMLNFKKRRTYEGE